MQTSEFIQTAVLLPRVRHAGVLVVYDPAHRYRKLCRALESDALQVVDDLSLRKCLETKVDIYLA